MRSDYKEVPGTAGPALNEEMGSRGVAGTGVRFKQHRDLCLEMDNTEWPGSQAKTRRLEGMRKCPRPSTPHPKTQKELISPPLTACVNP